MGLQDRDYMHNRSYKKSKKAKSFHKKYFFIWLFLGIFLYLLIYHLKKSKEPTPVDYIVNRIKAINYVQVPYPDNNSTHYYIKSNNLESSIKIDSDEDNISTHYFIEIRDWDTNETIADVFLMGGRSVLVKVPLGEYKLHISQGEKWYGENLFGAATVTNESMKPIKIFKTKNSIHRENIKLHRRVDGNFPTQRVKN